MSRPERAGRRVTAWPLRNPSNHSFRVRTKLKDGGSYVTLDEKSYTDAQPDTKKAIRITAMPDNFGVEIAMRQTAGSLRVITCEFFDAKG